MARYKLNEGDVFTIPLGNGEFGFGQAISEYNKLAGSFMIGIFSLKKSQVSNISLEEICSSELLFLGFTFDARLYHKDWALIGNYSKNIKNILLPYYRLGLPPNDMYLVNHKGERLREIDENIFNKLMYKTEIAPIRYENALKAYYKLQEWKGEDYDKMLYTSTLDSNNIANQLLN